MESVKLSLCMKLDNPGAAGCFWHQIIFNNELHVVTPPNARSVFNFSHIVRGDTGPLHISAVSLTEEVLQGSNAMIFTVDAFDLFEKLIHSAVAHIQSKTEGKYRLLISLFELQDERITDLGKLSLKNTDSTKAAQRRNSYRAITSQMGGKLYIEDPGYILVESEEEVAKLLQFSRSITEHSATHQVLTLFVNTLNKHNRAISNSKLVLVNINSQCKDATEIAEVMRQLHSRYIGQSSAPVAMDTNQLTAVLDPIIVGPTSLHVWCASDLAPQKSTLDLLRFVQSFDHSVSVDEQERIDRGHLNELKHFQEQLEAEVGSLTESIKECSHDYQASLDRLRSLVGFPITQGVHPKDRKNTKISTFRDATKIVTSLQADRKKLQTKLHEFQLLGAECHLVSSNNSAKRQEEKHALIDEIDRVLQLIELAQVERYHQEPKHVKSLQDLVTFSHLKVEQEATPVHSFPEYFTHQQHLLLKANHDFRKGQILVKPELTSELRSRNQDQLKTLNHAEKKGQKRLTGADNAVREIMYTLSARVTQLDQKLTEVKQEHARLESLQKNLQPLVSHHTRRVSHCTPEPPKQAHLRSVSMATLNSPSQSDPVSACKFLQAEIQDMQRQLEALSTEKPMIQQLTEEAEFWKEQYTALVRQRLASLPKLKTTPQNAKSHLLLCHTRHSSLQTNSNFSKLGVISERALKRVGTKTFMKTSATLKPVNL